jgi:hypothetical protein
MKKLVIATAVAVLSGFASYAMEKTSLEKLNDYICEWSEELIAPISAERIERECEEFSTDPFKEKLQKEIGDDPLAQDAFKLFHAYDFVGLWKYWEQNNNHMLPNNAARFRDLLALAAPIINDNESDRPIVKKIITLVGKEKCIPYYIPQFPQFGYEMFFCIMKDTEWGTKNPKESLSRLCEHICYDIADNSIWPLVKEERILLMIVGSREDNGELMCRGRFKTMLKNGNFDDPGE